MTKILAINTGSSSFKGSLFDFSLPNPKEALWEGSLDWGKNSTKAKFKTTLGTWESSPAPSTFKELLTSFLEHLWKGSQAPLKDPSEITVVVHRVVHGGEGLIYPCPITPLIKQTIEDLKHLAPLHNPVNREGIAIAEEIFPKAAHWACFDTAFHHTIPEAIYTYPIPLRWRQMGVRRYGFHGISHQYCSKQAASLIKQPIEDLKILCCHLGNGSSLCAIQGGQSRNTTMGFTPLDGLMMGTRSGTFDTSAVLYLQEQCSDLGSMLNKESGIKGIFGKSSDMRELMEGVAENDPVASLAITMYIQILKENIGRMLLTLEGIDLLIFTGGIGENSPFIRDKACQALHFLGAEIDTSLNEKSIPDTFLSTPSSKVAIALIHTEENWEMAQSVYLNPTCP